jgi:Acetyltransferase (GNAT) domain
LWQQSTWLLGSPPSNAGQASPARPPRSTLGGRSGRSVPGEGFGNVSLSKAEQEIAVPAVRSYEPGLAEIWDDLVGRSCNGTMLHTRGFISYHGDRFRDRSLVLEDRRGKVVGVFPAAADRSDPELVVSHPGLTYGGLVHDGSVRGASMIGALEEIASCYRSLGCRRLRYKAVPAIYHVAPADDDLYALFRLGARRYRCDLSAAIDLSHRGRVSQLRVRSRKRAEAAGVSADEGWSEIASFWRILECHLDSRYGVSPVHSLGEIELLHDRFPDEIILIAAKIGEVLIGGTVLFLAGPVLHMQYTATTEEGRAKLVTDFVMERAIDLARQLGCRFFDFGTSTVDQGWSLNQGLYQFKVSFGAGGAVYDHYELDLRQ